MAEFLEPDRIVQSFALQPGDYVADFGAGHGFFTMAMARAVGGDGKVYALDIQKSVLEVIRAKAKLEHLLNVEYVWADLEKIGGSKLTDAAVDFVIIANILFQAEDKQTLMKESNRVLRIGGRLTLIEWNPVDEGKGPSLGPPIPVRVGKEIALSFAKEAGFQMDREFDAGAHHYGLLFKKP